MNKPHTASSAGKTVSFVYLGTFANSDSKGIYVCQFDSDTGELTVPELAAESRDPNFIAIDPDRRFLYAVGEFSPSDTEKGGSASAFSICGKTGKLSPINQVSSCGTTPCHAAVDRSGRYLLVSNYSSGSLTVFPIETNGSLANASTFIQHAGSSVNPDRQTTPHVHSITLDAANQYALAADLGLDQIAIYRFNASNGKLEPNVKMPQISLPPGSGPRHFAFHPSGDYGYIINEMANTIVAFKYLRDDGVLHKIQSITTIPQGYDPATYTSEIQVHPSGKFLYGANRGHDSIATFAIEQDSGKLSPVDIQACGGNWPRHFSIDPTGKWLLVANERSSQVVVFGIDQETGRLAGNGKKNSVPAPACIRFLQSHPTG